MFLQRSPNSMVTWNNPHILGKNQTLFSSPLEASSHLQNIRLHYLPQWRGSCERACQVEQQQRDALHVLRLEKEMGFFLNLAFSKTVNQTATNKQINKMFFCWQRKDGSSESASIGAWVCSIKKLPTVNDFITHPSGWWLHSVVFNKWHIPGLILGGGWKEN